MIQLIEAEMMRNAFIAWLHSEGFSATHVWPNKKVKDSKDVEQELSFFVFLIAVGADEQESLKEDLASLGDKYAATTKIAGAI